MLELLVPSWQRARRWAYLGFAVLLVAWVGNVAQGQQFLVRVGPELAGYREIEAVVGGRDPFDPTSVGEFGHTRVTALTAGAEPRDLALERHGHRLVGRLTGSNLSTVVVGECILGVIVREQPILFRYYPQGVAGDPERINMIPPLKRDVLQILPRFQGEQLHIKVIQNGQPIVGEEMTIIDAEAESRGSQHEVELTTDEQGEASFAIPGDGDFTLYVRRERATPGSYQGSSYDAVQDVASLTFRWPLVETGSEALMHRIKLATVNNMLGPLVLFFALGFLAKLIKSDLRFPPEAYQLIVIYLLLSIAYEGGHQLKAEPSLLAVMVPLSTGFVVNGIVSLVAIGILKLLFRFDAANSCALGALYGSDSAGLFAVAIALVRGFHLDTDGFMAAMLAVMEIPGVLVGIIAYQMLRPRSTDSGDDHLGAPPRGLGAILLHELKSPGVYLLLGGIVVGYLTVNAEYLKTEPFFITPFKGVMCIFLFENGLKAGEQISALRRGAWLLIPFGILFPLTSGLLAIGVAKLLGLKLGSAVLFAVLVAAPSNIAAPAAMRLAIPEANPSIYFTTSLGISFPALVIAGVPIFYLVAQLVY